MRRAHRYRDIQQSSFSNIFVTSPTSQLIRQPFRRFTYVTANYPTLPLLHLRHSSFSNPSFDSPTSQAIHLRHLASSPCIANGCIHSQPCTGSGLLLNSWAPPVKLLYFIPSISFFRFVRIFLLSSDIRGKESIAIVKKFDFDFLWFSILYHSHILKKWFRKNVCVCVCVCVCVTVSERTAQTNRPISFKFGI